MDTRLIPERFLFRFLLPCRRRRPLWTRQGSQLDESYRIFPLALLEGQRIWADFRMAWDEQGLAFCLLVQGKKQPVWCRAGRPEDSDSLQVWIDTRDVHSVHRAGRFCYRFLFMPAGGGPRLSEPTALWLPIERAREQPRPVASDSLHVLARLKPDGYVLEAFVSAEALSGFDPLEQPRIGFNYAVWDREFGLLTLSPGPPMPYAEDPSLWVSLELMP
ncbi:MAG: hypothetical protein NZ602_02185 [Thermoguttaceae bacterium]|nr:hypothetical protein [Thermoguttaceae bacterium]MDW8039440.1 hypothetical protein [Thermoguttaceae bacterium]